MHVGEDVFTARLTRFKQLALRSMTGKHARVVEVFVVLDDVRDEHIALICRYKKILLNALRLEEVLHELLLLDVIRTA